MLYDGKASCTTKSYLTRVSYLQLDMTIVAKRDVHTKVCEKNVYEHESKFTRYVDAVR